MGEYHRLYFFFRFLRIKYQNILHLEIVPVTSQKYYYAISFLNFFQTRKLCLFFGGTEELLVRWKIVP